MSRIKSAVLGVLGSRLMAQTKVDEVEVLSDHFRLIVLSSEKFKTAEMQPAARIRLNVGNWEMRAYTPLSIDVAAARIGILAYLHGNGPGSMWARSAGLGDFTHVIGPQRSLDLIGLSQPAVFFGDETSLAAAKTLQSHLTPNNATRFVFEVSSRVEAAMVAERLELRNAQFYDRQAEDRHLPQVIEAIQHALGSIATSHLVLTGNARSIQSIRGGLRTGYAGVVDYHVRAYWARGKAGLE